MGEERVKRGERVELCVGIIPDSEQLSFTLTIAYVFICYLTFVKTTTQK